MFSIIKRKKTKELFDYFPFFFVIQNYFVKLLPSKKFLTENIFVFCMVTLLKIVLKQALNPRLFSFKKMKLLSIHPWKCQSKGDLLIAPSEHFFAVKIVAAVGLFSSTIHNLKLKRFKQTTKICMAQLDFLMEWLYEQTIIN